MGPDAFLVTRFNLPSKGVESLIRAEEHWLRNRLELFERYTVPSVQAQTSRPGWIVYIDPESPSWLTERLGVLQASGVLTVLARTEVDGPAVAADVRSLLGKDSGAVVTANLDNDDALANDFIERLRSAPTSGARNAVYLVEGLILAGGRVYARTDRVNAFCAVRENLDGALTCWADWHNRLGRHMPVVEVRGGPAWIQVVHGSNVSNRVRGRLVCPEPFAAHFPGLLDDIESPPRVTLLRDTYVLSPTRAVRDTVRSGVRRGLVATFGKQGLDRVKWVVTRPRRQGVGKVGHAVVRSSIGRRVSRL